MTAVSSQGLKLTDHHPLGLNTDLFGNGPDEPDQLPCNGHDHLIGMLASSDEVSVAFTPTTSLYSGLSLPPLSV